MASYISVPFKPVKKICVTYRRVGTLIPALYPDSDDQTDKAKQPAKAEAGKDRGTTPPLFPREK